ncbi:MAG: DmsE family decaheme c-type cytochrome [Deltaproteobacteria bacterium]|nr:DmsE family decaheme c-type cytochrome [Deltaproteobacteria bacterium]MBI3076713.1 DmsE family decaheme c-type cytochrome [Deltaproteobacteria bacterium]
MRVVTRHLLFTGLLVLLAACLAREAPAGVSDRPRAAAQAPAAGQARPAAAAQEWPALPPPTATYVGAQACEECHKKQFATFSQTQMGKIFLKNPRSPAEARGCETCHGPGSVHVAAAKADRGKGVGTIVFRKDSPLPLVERNAICLSCHEKGLRLNWRGSPHEGRGVACTECHRVMVNVSEKRQFVKETEMETCFQCHLMRRSQLQRSSHMPYREGKMTCSDCHNPHGTATPKLLRANSINENCYRCHAEKRGPFLWEHPPVRENCLNCHEPHGSNHDKLLKVARPRACQRCHVEQFHPTTPQRATSRFVFNRSCQNCHSQIHGSNHPSGVRFQR